MINKFVVIDLETTGNVPKKGDRIIQFAAVVIEDGTITEQFASLINPNKKIPVFIEELTGLNNEMVKDAPLFSEIAPKVKELLRNSYFVAHNVHFDLSFLQEELNAAGFEGYEGPILDTVEMARILYPTADGYKLTDLAEQENLTHERPHQADSDALVTAELFLRLHKKLSSLPLKTLQQFARLSVGLKSNLKQLVSAIMSEKSIIDESLPDTVENFHNLALKKIAPLEENDTDITDVKFPETEQEKIAMMQNAFSSFEIKNGQYVMMDRVYHSFQNHHHTLIEAGTGVGKSLAYLLPAAFFVKQSGSRIVVSTHTIQLQEQLLSKEIPLMNEILPFKVTSVLLKGRSHYLSLEKFAQTLKEDNDNYDTILTKMQILVWLIETETGDRDELNLSSGGMIYWNKVKGDQSVFLQNKVWGERDFYKRAKAAAKKADLIITNHSMLLSDLSSKASILPDFDYAVIDEGHHLEKAAGRFLGYSLDYLSVRLLLTQFGTYETRQLFYKMEQILASSKLGNGDILHTFELNQIVSDLFYESDEFFKIAAVVSKKAPSAKKNSNVRLKTRLNSVLKGKESIALAISGERMAFLLKDLIHALNIRLEWIKKEKNQLSSEQKGFMEEIYSFVTELEELRESFYELILKESGLVKWIEVDTRSPQNATTIYAQPATVGEALNRRFFQQKKAVVITSATLTVKQSFDYMLNELGLDRHKVEM
ncbi:MAG: ATP-dependent DNA helicase DinG, partial [Bacillota bacterium]|nr:ATP-dependent DNA helicase DinG [Bacillota bacterium]